MLIRASMAGAIVHVMGWESQQYGSFERFIEKLALRCEAHGFATHLVFPSPPRSRDFVRNVHARIHEVPLARHPFDRRAWRGLRDVIVKSRATHVHAHFGLDAMLAMRIARANGVAHRFLTKHIMPGGRLKLAGLRHRWLAAQAEVFFAVSDQVAARLLALGVPPAKVERVHLGVDPQAYRAHPARRAAARAALGLTERRIVLSTSHLRPGKGVELLPALAAELDRDPGNTTLLLAGDGPLREQLERAARALPPGTFQLLGVRQDIPELLAAADLYVFPTTGDEGLGLSWIEAMAAGLPVVASAVSDLPKLAGDATRLVPPGDAAALLAACRELLTSPAEAAELGARARRVVEERLSVDAAVETHLARYLASAA